MKFTCTTDILLPRDKVVEYFMDNTLRTAWDTNCVSIELLSGAAGEVGAISKIIFPSGQGDQELIETITHNDLPNEISGIYEHKHMVNTMTNRFGIIDDYQTRWESTVEYTEFRSFMPKLMAFFFPGMFRREVDKHLLRFKQFAEQKEAS